MGRDIFLLNIAIYNCIAKLSKKHDFLKKNKKKLKKSPFLPQHPLSGGTAPGTTMPDAKKQGIKEGLRL
jgi:hypothetical protein